MQVEINGEEKAVQASDIKVGDVITWGAHQDFYIKTDCGCSSYVRLTGCGVGILAEFTAAYIDNDFENLRIVTDKCKLVVTL